MEGRIFTLAEANNLVPELESLFAETKKARQYLFQIRGEIQKARDHSPVDGGSPKGPSYIKGLDFIVKRLEKIQEMGVLVKDLERGLCDFPFMKEGRLVYLCWMQGEPEIRWWHSTDTGFAGRKPLDQED